MIVHARTDGKPAIGHCVSLDYFLPRLPEAVILLVLMRSPMYFCRNLLLLLSLSCSSLTASMRLKMVTRESCNALACLHTTIQSVLSVFVSQCTTGGGATVCSHLLISSRASLPILSMSSLVLRGLMALTSSGPKWASTGPTAELSRGTTKGPLLFRLGSRGRTGMG
jgi:hypothetical protein